jgi:serine/threonine protein kinase
LVTEHERAVLEIVRTIRHPNIVELLGSYNYRENLNLLFPYADTDLRAFFRSRAHMSPETVFSSIYGLADALSHIHKLTFLVMVSSRGGLATTMT